MLVSQVNSIDVRSYGFYKIWWGSYSDKVGERAWLRGFLRCLSSSIAKIDAASRAEKGMEC